MEKIMFKRPKWYETGLHFECTQCGNCCSGVPGYVWVNEREIEEIAAYLKMSLDEFGKKYLRRVGRQVSLIELPNYDCVFLQRMENGVGCSIYPVRPKQCQTWPFWDDNLKSGNEFNRRTSRCPGVNRGKKFNQEEIESIRSDSPC
jgi:Fe-S-cluster containining protein